MTSIVRKLSDTIANLDFDGPGAKLIDGNHSVLERTADGRFVHVEEPRAVQNRLVNTAYFGLNSMCAVPIVSVGFGTIAFLLGFGALVRSAFVEPNSRLSAVKQILVGVCGMAGPATAGLTNVIAGVAAAQDALEVINVKARERYLHGAR